MPYTPEEVVELAHRGRKVDAAEVGKAWAAHLKTTLATLFAAFDDGAEPDIDDLAKVIRHGSDWQKSEMPTLYMSERYLRHLDDPAHQSALVPDERGICFEHVVPIKFSLHSAHFLQDPIKAVLKPDAAELKGLPWLNRVARALLTPICYITTHEDRRIDRLAHRNWVRPFQRYSDPLVLVTAPDAPIVVHRTRDGTRIADPDGFTWADHITELEASPAHAPGLAVVRTFFTDLADREPALFARMQARPGSARWPVTPVYGDRRGKHRAADRAALYDQLIRATRDGPRAGPGPAMQVPVNRDRLNMVVRHPDAPHAVLLRINIGPNYGKFELLHIYGNMHPDGPAWMAAVAKAVNDRKANVTLTSQKEDSDKRCGFDIRFPKCTTAQKPGRIADALRLIVTEMQAAYPRIPIAA